MPAEMGLLTPEEVEKLRDEFLERLESSHARHHRKQFVIVIGGAPGSGKTTAADKMVYLAGAYHVQSNSARELLRENHKTWGPNVPRLIQAVVEDLVAREWSVVLDGMMLEREERCIVWNLATKYRAIASFNAMICNPRLAERRTRKRYADGKLSSFNDWRCDPGKLEEYIASIYTRTKKVEELLSRIPTGPSERIWTIPNDEGERDLVSWLQPIWQNIAREL